MNYFINKYLYLSDHSPMHLVVREWVNGLWFAVSLCVVAIFGWRLSRIICKRESHWYTKTGNKAAIALFFYFLGETLIRGWVWLLLMFENNGWKVDLIQNDWYIALIAASISTWAALCCIYVFSRSHWTWIGSLIVIIILVAIEMYLF